MCASSLLVYCSQAWESDAHWYGAVRWWWLASPSDVCTCCTSAQLARSCALITIDWLLLLAWLYYYTTTTILYILYTIHYYTLEPSRRNFKPKAVIVWHVYTTVYTSSAAKFLITWLDWQLRCPSKSKSSSLGKRTGSKKAINVALISAAQLAPALALALAPSVFSLRLLLLLLLLSCGQHRAGFLRCTCTRTHCACALTHTEQEQAVHCVLVHFRQVAIISSQ